MTIVAHAEQNEIVAVNHFTALRRENVQSVLIFLRRNLRIDLASHARDRFLRHSAHNEKRLTRHPEIALRIVRRDAAFVAECKKDAVPWQVPRDPGELGVNRAGRVSAGERNPKLVALRQGGAGVTQNKFRRVVHEVLRAEDVALHVGR